MKMGSGEATGTQGSPDQRDKIDTSDEACALACMLVSNPQGQLRKDGDGWQRRINDLIRALRDERNDLAKRIQQFVDLFVWESHEETGEVVPHLDRQFPDFADAVTALRDGLRVLRSNDDRSVPVPSREPNKPEDA
jgi:hypothetical protein